MWRQPESTRERNTACRNHLTVTVELIAQRGVIGQIHKIHVVVQGQGAGALVIMGHARWAVNVFELQQAGVGAAIRVNKAVHAEIAIVGPLAVVAAIIKDGAPILGFAFVDAMVAPFPQQAAHETGMTLDKLEVIFQVAGAVTHAMAVFAHQVRLVRLLVKERLNAFQGRIHVAEQINVGKIILALLAVILGTFVMGQAGGVKLFGPGQSFLKGAAVSAFVAHRPDDHAGAVFIALHTAACAVHGGLGKFRVVGNRLVPVLNMIVPVNIAVTVQFRCTVAFVIRFVNHKKSVFIAELIKIGDIRVMAGADGVKIVPLDHGKVGLGLFQPDGITGDGIRFMPVDAVDFDGVAVDKNLVICHMNFPDANTIRDGFAGRFQHKGIKIRLFGIPQNRGRDRNNRAVGKGFIIGVRCRSSSADQGTGRIVNGNAGGDGQIAVA